jgi:hypothetical protein
VGLDLAGSNGSDESVSKKCKKKISKIFLKKSNIK